MENNKSSSEKNSSEVHMKRRSKKFANYSISELFQIKAYIQNSNIQFNNFCDQLGVDVKIMSEINDVSIASVFAKRPYTLKKNMRVLVPFGCQKKFLHDLKSDDLNLEDVIQHKLEEKKQDISPENFYIYYVTTEGDILGKLTLFDDFISFKPVSVEMAGLYDFTTYSLTKNKKMEFKIDYLDIVGQPIKIFLPSTSQNKDTSKNSELAYSYLLQINLANNGYGKFHDEDTKKFVEKLRSKNEGISSIALKIRPKTLVGKDLDNKSKENLVDRLRDYITLKTTEKIKNQYNFEFALDKSHESYKDYDSETVVPYFDINFNNIFEEETLTIEKVDKNIDKLHKFFGYKKELDSCTHIYNQSLISQTKIFDELAKNLKKNKSDPNNPEMLEKIPEIMEDTSDIITNKEAHYINKYIPSYLKGNMWQLYYSKTRDGTSYRTLMRQCSDKGPVVLLVRDVRGNIFGGFYSTDFRHANQYVGTGESFLFKFEGGDYCLKHWKATGKNSWFCRCDSEGIYMGSEPYSGLFIDNTVTNGSTHACQTYDNTQLSYSDKFRVHKLEIWGFDIEAY